MNYIYDNGIFTDIYLYQQDNTKDPFLRSPHVMFR